MTKVALLISVPAILAIMIVKIWAGAIPVARLIGARALEEARMLPTPLILVWLAYWLMLASLVGPSVC